MTMKCFTRMLLMPKLYSTSSFALYSQAGRAAVTTATAAVGRPFSSASRFLTSSSDQNDNNTASSKTELEPFPAWIRLQGRADHAVRHTVTDEVSNVIGVSGGFLTHHNMLSDMITVLALEDVAPDCLATFQERLKAVPGFFLNEDSNKQLQLCHERVLHSEETRIPETVRVNLQITWLGAEGRLRQEIPSVPG